MNDFLKQDVFFFVTTAFVVLLTAVLLVAAFYIIRILRDVRSISETAKAETKAIAEDINELRSNVKNEGAKLKHFANFFSSMYKRRK